MRFSALVSIFILSLVYVAFNAESESGMLPPPDILGAVHVTKFNQTSVEVSISAQPLDNQPKFNIRFKYQLLGPQGECVEGGERGELIQFNQTREAQSCEQKLFMFNGCTSSRGSEYLSAHSLCSVKERHFSFPEVESIRVDDLLPSQSYAFHVQLSDEQGRVQGDEVWKIVCTDETAPICRPEVDLGSFAGYDDTGEGSPGRSVEVYYRPVPRILGDAALNQAVACIEQSNNVITLNETSKIETAGRASLVASPDLAYLCEVWSENQRGRSSTAVIKIPRQKHIIRHAHHLQVYATAFEDGEYRLRWPTIGNLIKDVQVEIYSGLVAHMNGNYSGLYTLYWCTTASRAEPCQSIEGMLTINESTMTVKIPSSVPEARPYCHFGVSYRSADNWLFSGIQWANCTASWDEYQTLNGSLSLNALATQKETSISVGWKFAGCKAVVSAIVSYELRYYRQDVYNHCPLSFDWSRKKAPIWSNDRAHSSLNLTNELQFKIQLDGLTPSSLYIIKMRALTVDGKYSDWSRPILAATEPTQRMKRSCLKIANVIWFFAMIVVVVVVIHAIFWHREDGTPPSGVSTSVAAERSAAPAGAGRNARPCPSPSASDMNQETSV